MSFRFFLPLRFYCFSAVVLLLSAGNVHAQTWYRQYSGSALDTFRNYTSSTNDSSAVYVAASGTYHLFYSRISTTGNSTSTDSSSNNGLNAGILLRENSVGNFLNDTITTTGSGANGAYAKGAGSDVSLISSAIATAGNRAHGVDVTYTAMASLSNVYVTTTGDTASAIATDCGGGTIVMDGGALSAAGHMSAGIYSTGHISVANATVVSTADNGAVIDVNGAIYLTNTSLTGAINGLMVHNTVGMPYAATMRMTGGSITALGGHAFYDTAAAVNVNINHGTAVSASSGYLLYALGHATAVLTAQKETITGNIYADNTSTASVSFIDTTALSSIITNASVSIDGSSTWSLSGISHINAFTDAEGVNTTALTVSNIIGNGFSVYYSAALTGNAWLAGKTYALVGGGCLLPEGATCSGTATGITAISGADDITVYPNPAADVLTIACGTAYANASLSIIGVDGRVISTAVIRAGAAATSVNVRNLPSGLYFVLIANSTGRRLMKFIKQ